MVLVRFGEEEAATLLESWAVPDDVNGFLSWYNGSGLSYSVDYVVIEHFVNRGIRGADLTPCFVEGAARAVFYTQPTKVVLQPPSGKDTAVPDTVMKKAGYYLPGDHHKDRNSAMKHVLFWLKKQRHVPTLRRLFPNE